MHTLVRRARALTRGASASIRQGSRSLNSRRETIVKRMNTTIAALVCASLVIPMLPLTQAGGRAQLARRPSANPPTALRSSARRGWGPGALFGGIIAGALIAAAISEGRADDRDMRRCDRDFRGFDPRTRNVHRSLRRRAHLPLPALAHRPHASTLLRRRLQDRRLIAFEDGTAHRRSTLTLPQCHHTTWHSSSQPGTVIFA